MARPKSTTTRRTLLLAALVVLSATAPATVAADHDDGPLGPLGELISDDHDEEETTTDDASTLDKAKSYGSEIKDWARGGGGGLVARAQYEGGNLNPWNGGPDLDAEADRTVEAVNNDSEEIRVYLNEQTAPASYDGSQYEVHEVTLVNEEHEIEETLYLVGSYNATSNEWENLTATREYSGEVDQEHRLYGFLAESASEETEYFIENFVYPGTVPRDDGAYLGRMSSRYGGIFGQQVESTMLDDGFDGSES